MKGNSSPRSYGTKLLEPKSNQAKVESQVTTRIFDVNHFERTGELKYLDEEGTTMKLITAVKKTKIMRAEITTIEQFEAIGNTADVSKKYDVSKVTVQGLKISLQAKKAREEADKVLEDQKGSSTEETEQVYLETEIHELSEGEIDEIVNVVTNEQRQQGNTDQAPSPLNHTGDRDVGGKGEACYLIDGDPIKLTDDTLGKIIDALEEHWEKPDKDIEELWKSIAAGIRTLHKTHLNRAEMEFQERLLGVIEEC